MKTVVCPGSFDPITNGHLDIIRRASGLFDHVIVLVANNIAKNGHFTPQERVEMIQEVLENEPSLGNVEVRLFSGLLVDFLREHSIAAIVKGLRAISDFEYEFQMALTNKKMYGDCETIFLTPKANNMYLSSSIVRQVGSLGGDISDFVPACVHDTIKKKLMEEKS